MHLLLVEDDNSLQTTLQRALIRMHIRVSACTDGLQALALWQSLEPDVLVLDLSLPGRDGLDILQAGRALGLQTPVLILTARGTVGDKVLGLNAGADDYLPKPFDLDELEARVRALYRRTHADRDPEPERRVGRLRQDRQSGAIYCDQRILDLPPRELVLLQTLMAHPGHAVSKEQLLNIVFPEAMDVHAEAIEVVVYRLRKKLLDTGATLMTLRGLGYLLKTES